MFAAYALEYADPPGLSSYGLQGPPPDVDGVLPWRGFVESRGSGSKWTYIVISPLTGRWSEEVGTVTDGSPLDTLTRTTRRSWDGSTLGTSAIDWQPEDGTLKIYANPIADYQDGLNSTNRGTSAPAWAVPGTKWEDTTGAPTSVLLKIMDAGGDWITLGTLNETANTFTPTGLDGVLPLAGGTLTGNLTISKAGPQFVLNATSGDPYIAYQAAADTRFLTGYSVSLDGWYVSRFVSGVQVDVPILVSRTTGNMQFDSPSVYCTAALTAVGALQGGSILSLSAIRSNNDTNYGLNASGNNRMLEFASYSSWSNDIATGRLSYNWSGAERVALTAGGNVVVTGGVLTSGGAVMISSNGTLGTAVFTLATRPSAAANNWRIILVSDAGGNRFLNISNTTGWFYADGVAA